MGRSNPQRPLPTRLTPVKLTYPLPEKVLRMIDPTERKKLGTGYATASETASRVQLYNERKLHSQIRQLLHLKGIVFFESRMDKRSHGTVGWPDFTFAVLLQKPNKADPTNVTCVPVPIAWEVKIPGGKPTPEQQEMLWRVQKEPNAWRVVVIRSLEQAVDELKALGL